MKELCITVEVLGLLIDAFVDRGVGGLRFAPTCDPQRERVGVPSHSFSNGVVADPMKAELFLLLGFQKMKILEVVEIEEPQQGHSLGVPVRPLAERSGDVEESETTLSQSLACVPGAVVREPSFWGKSPGEK